MIKVELHPVLGSRLLFVFDGRGLVFGVLAAVVVALEQIRRVGKPVQRARLLQLLLLPIPAKRLVLLELALILNHARDFPLDVLFEDHDVIGLDGNLGRVNQLLRPISVPDIFQKLASKNIKHGVLTFCAFDGCLQVLGLDLPRLAQAHAHLDLCSQFEF
jgi:hypothetical protein